MLSRNDIETIRLIVRAGDDYAAIKQLLSQTPWEIQADGLDFGYLRVWIPDTDDEAYRLIIGYRDSQRPPYCLLTFGLFDDSEEHLPAFNAAFLSVAEILTGYLGEPALSGEHQLSFRTWSYAWRRWSLPEGEFTLVQGEFDIQDGLDVTLWMQQPGTPIEDLLNSQF